jgi:hypothetical protein
MSSQESRGDRCSTADGDNGVLRIKTSVIFTEMRCSSVTFTEMQEDAAKGVFEKGQAPALLLIYFPAAPTDPVTPF